MSAPLPLFAVQLIKEIEQLVVERVELADRIKDLPPTSHCSIALQDRQKRLTCRALKAECALSEKETPHG